MLRETQEYGGHSVFEAHADDAPAGEAAIRRAETKCAPPSLQPYTGDEPGPDSISLLRPIEHANPATLSASADAGGHQPFETHVDDAACEDISGQRGHEAHEMRAGSGEGHACLASRLSSADPALIDTIREQWRRRQAWVRAPVRRRPP